ncbi:hypothetical protein FISHEDRAFT_70617 [Fistulina hepatica ATCC 64428]|uniref:Uncharacterized protein n=1 Tax=Fistulina hepatica ATCC 64428 TaxID=1128425 RepID=A0A0D7AJ73_9AGAR|nr:hypothetical protein FISHEDRAFT_70617 [Fistulina hepatica ATCC 64428]
MTSDDIGGYGVFYPFPTVGGAELDESTNDLTTKIGLAKRVKLATAAPVIIYAPGTTSIANSPTASSSATLSDNPVLGHISRDGHPKFPFHTTNILGQHLELVRTPPPPYDRSGSPLLFQRARRPDDPGTNVSSSPISNGSHSAYLPSQSPVSPMAHPLTPPSAFRKRRKRVFPSSPNRSPSQPFPQTSSLCPRRCCEDDAEDLPTASITDESQTWPISSPADSPPPVPPKTFSLMGRGGHRGHHCAPQPPSSVWRTSPLRSSVRTQSDSIPESQLAVAPPKKPKMISAAKLKAATLAPLRIVESLSIKMLREPDIRPPIDLSTPDDFVAPSFLDISASKELDSPLSAPRSHLSSYVLRTPTRVTCTSQRPSKRRSFASLTTPTQSSFSLKSRKSTLSLAPTHTSFSPISTRSPLFQTPARNSFAPSADIFSARHPQTVEMEDSTLSLEDPMREGQASRDSECSWEHLSLGSENTPSLHRVSRDAGVADHDGAGHVERNKFRKEGWTHVFKWRYPTSKRRQSVPTARDNPAGISGEHTSGEPSFPDGDNEPFSSVTEFHSPVGLDFPFTSSRESNDHHFFFPPILRKRQETSTSVQVSDVVTSQSDKPEAACSDATVPGSVMSSTNPVTASTVSAPTLMLSGDLPRPASSASSLWLDWSSLDSIMPVPLELTSWSSWRTACGDSAPFAARSDSRASARSGSLISAIASSLDHDVYETAFSPSSQTEHQPGQRCQMFYIFEEGRYCDIKGVKCEDIDNANFYVLDAQEPPGKHANERVSVRLSALTYMPVTHGLETYFLHGLCGGTIHVLVQSVDSETDCAGSPCEGFVDMDMSSAWKHPQAFRGRDACDPGAVMSAIVQDVLPWPPPPQFAASVRLISASGSSRSPPTYLQPESCSDK